MIATSGWNLPLVKVLTRPFPLVGCPASNTHWISICSEGTDVEVKRSATCRRFLENLLELNYPWDLNLAIAFGWNKAVDSKAIRANTCSWWSESLVTMGNRARNQLLSPRTEKTNGHGFWLHFLSYKGNSVSVWIRLQSLHWGLATTKMIDSSLLNYSMDPPAWGMPSQVTPNYS